MSDEPRTAAAAEADPRAGSTDDDAPAPAVGPARGTGPDAGVRSGAETGTDATPATAAETRADAGSGTTAETRTDAGPGTHAGTGTDAETPADAGTGGSPAGAAAVPTDTPGTVVLAVLALVWLGAMLWAAQVAISSSGAAEMAVTAAAYALPGAVSASLAAGAAVALAGVGRLVRRGRLAGPTVRVGAATVAGVVVGSLGALVVLRYGDGPTIAVVAGTVAAAATIGGAVAGVRAPRVVAAVVVAALTVFVAAFVLSVFQEPVLNLYGVDDGGAAGAGAVGWFATTASVVSGLAAGLVAFAYLRRAGHRAGEAAPRWPLYAVAGAGPGLLLIAAELLSRTAGARVLALAGSISEADRAAQDLLSGARVNNALIVTFIGALTAIIAIGRTMRPTDTAD